LRNHSLSDTRSRYPLKLVAHVIGITWEGVRDEVPPGCAPQPVMLQIDSPETNFAIVRNFASERGLMEAMGVAGECFFSSLFAPPSSTTLNEQGSGESVQAISGRVETRPSSCGDLGWTIKPASHDISGHAQAFRQFRVLRHLILEKMRSGPRLQRTLISTQI
jgi:hypothetical protein